MASPPARSPRRAGDGRPLTPSPAHVGGGSGAVRRARCTSGSGIAVPPFHVARRPALSPVLPPFRLTSDDAALKTSYLLPLFLLPFLTAACLSGEAGIQDGARTAAWLTTRLGDETSPLPTLALP